jgi:hypothetical protein
MNANLWSCRRRGIAFVLAAVAASVSAGAGAENLCSASPTVAGQRACELAKLDRPEELRHFSRRTKGTYRLRIDEYVAAQDITRWDLARRGAEKRSSTDVAIGEREKTAGQ